MARRWYVVQTFPGNEQSVIDNIPREYKTFCPRYRRLRENKCSLVLPLFPSYFFVRFCVKKDAWAEICNVKKVVTILGIAGGKPVALPKGFVESMKKGASRRGILELVPEIAANPTYTPGQKLEIMVGAFEGKVVVCEKVVKNQVVALMSLLQREIRVILPLQQVSLATT